MPKLVLGMKLVRIVNQSRWVVVSFGRNPIGPYAKLRGVSNRSAPRVTYLDEWYHYYTVVT